MKGQVEESQKKFREGTFFFAVVESGVGKHRTDGERCEKKQGATKQLPTGV